MDESLKALKAQYQAQRANAIARYRHRPNPQRLLHRLSRATDNCLKRLFQHYPLPTGSACLALGGYGRQALYPHSDVDLLFLIPDPINKAEEQHKLEQLIAACWDLGLNLSHSVETLEQCLERCTQDVALQTALLEARYLAGDKGFWFELKNQYQKQLDLVDFYLLKRQEMQQRHHNYQNTPYALEPNCKESPGGLRDLQLLGWLAHAAGVGRDWAEIAQSGLLTEAEKKALERVSLAMMRLRIELHLLTGRAEDTLRFDLQPQLAKIYDLSDTLSGRHASEALMQRYYWATRLVTQLLTTLLQSFDEIIHPPKTTHVIRLDANFAIVNQHLKLVHPAGLATHPDNLLKGILWFQKHPEILGFDALTLRALWHGRKLIDSDFRSNPHNKHLFLKILQQPQRVYESLALLNLFNILPRYIPAFRAVVGQMQHDLFHVYTVDQHTLRVIEHLSQLRKTQRPKHAPLLAHQLMKEFSFPWLLFLAALFHDIGKGQGGNHAELGAEIAGEFCREHALASQETEFIKFLVKEHLLFSHYAQKEDFYNPRILHQFIEKVNTIEKLNALYLLTIADIQATNPKIWTSWKATLFDSLYQQTRNLLLNQQSSAEILKTRRNTAYSKLYPLFSQSAYAEELWQQLDADYFARHPLNTIYWHFQTFTLNTQKKKGTDLPIINLRTLPTNAHSDDIHRNHTEQTSQSIKDHALWQVMIHANDQPELFMTLCETFERLGFSIQDAQIYTNPNGWVVDTFVVQAARAINEDQQGWILLINTLKESLLLLKDQKNSPQAHSFNYHDARSAQAQVFPLTPSAQLRHVQHSSWELSVLGTDRKGLLFDLSQFFANHKLNLRSAKIMTQGERVEDSFILDSKKLENNDFRATLIRDILRLLT